MAENSRARPATSASLAAITQTLSTTPPNAGPPPLPSDVDIPKAPLKTESWLPNPAYKGPNGGEMKWIPGPHMPHRQHLQLQRRASYTGYKFVPQPPSAEYLAMKLSDNPLGLMNMIPGEEFHLQGWSEPSMLILDDDTNGSSSTHLAGSAKPTFSPKIVRTPGNYRISSAASLSSLPLLGSGRSSAPVTPPRGSRAASHSPQAGSTGATNTSPHTHAFSKLLSPIAAQQPHLQRMLRVRRGYWNRRGDHLTEDGYIVYAPPALAYPAELSAYPLERMGYQNEEGAIRAWTARPELAESFPRSRRMPVRPYESYIVYVYRDSMGSLAPHASRRPSRQFHAEATSSIDGPSSTKRSSSAVDLQASLPPSLLSTWEMTCNPNPYGLPPFDPDTSSAENMDEWLEAFWPGYISSMLSTEAAVEEAPKDNGRAGSPSSKSLPLRVDPWDLDVRLAALNAKRRKSPTSSSSSYGSPASAHSRASSWSGSPGGHIPGTTRDVLEFPFGYPTPD